MASKKCKGCGDRYEKQPDHPPFRNWCSTECALSIARDAQERARAKKSAKTKRDKVSVKTADRKALREFNRRDVRWQHKQTQPVFNRMRVLQELLWFKERGQEPACISCGKPLGGDQWCCGHFKTVGSQGGMRYDPANSYLQHNRNCNMGLSGDIYGTKNTHGYIQGLKNRFGDAEGQSIIDHCETRTGTVKWEWQQLEDMRAGFNEEIRRLEKDLQ
jgi:hypothetical protein